MEAYLWNSTTQKRTLISTGRTRARPSTVCRLLAIGGVPGSRIVNMEVYCPKQNKWTMLKETTSHRSEYGLVLMGDRLIMVGGRSHLVHHRTVESLDLTTMTFTALSPISRARYGLVSAVLDGLLFAIGGTDGSTFLNTVERYDPKTNAWTTVAPLHVARAVMGVTVLNKRMYVMGGNDKESYHRTVECYDQKQDKWCFKAPMIKRRTRPGVGIANGFIYVMGGSNYLNLNSSNNHCIDSVERYDPGTDTWMLVSLIDLRFCPRNILI